MDPAEVVRRARTRLVPTNVPKQAALDLRIAQLLGLLPRQPRLVGALQVVADRRLADRARRRDRAVPPGPARSSVAGLLESSASIGAPTSALSRPRGGSRADARHDHPCVARSDGRAAGPARDAPNLRRRPHQRRRHARRQRLRGCPTPSESVPGSTGTGGRVLRNQRSGRSGEHERSGHIGTGARSQAGIRTASDGRAAVVKKPSRAGAFVFSLPRRCSSTRCRDRGVREEGRVRIHRAAATTRSSTGNGAIPADGTTRVRDGAAWSPSAAYDAGNLHQNTAPASRPTLRNTRRPPPPLNFQRFAPFGDSAS